MTAGQKGEVRSVGSSYSLSTGIDARAYRGPAGGDPSHMDGPTYLRWNELFRLVQ